MLTIVLDILPHDQYLSLADGPNYSASCAMTPQFLEMNSVFSNDLTFRFVDVSTRTCYDADPSDTLVHLYFNLRNVGKLIMCFSEYHFNCTYLHKECTSYISNTDLLKMQQPLLSLTSHIRPPVKPTKTNCELLHFLGAHKCCYCNYISLYCKIMILGWFSDA